MSASPSRHEEQLYNQLSTLSRKLGATRQELDQAKAELERLRKLVAHKSSCIKSALESLDGHSSLNVTPRDRDDEIVQCVFDTLEIA